MEEEEGLFRIMQQSCAPTPSGGFETGGRFSKDIRRLLSIAAYQRAFTTEPSHLRAPVRRALRARWATILSIAVQDALANSLTQEGTGLVNTGAQRELLTTDLWLDKMTLGAAHFPLPGAESEDDIAMELDMMPPPRAAAADVVEDARTALPAGH